MIALFHEPDFPTLGTTPFPIPELKKALSAAGPVTVCGLKELAGLAAGKLDLLVLPYGSAFPKEGWEGIATYLNGGGNLLVLGGRPFEVPVMRDGKGWRPEPPQTGYYQSLAIEQLNTVPPKRVARHEAVPDLPALEGLTFPPMEAHSLMVRSTEADEDNRTGSTGPMDSELKPLFWGLDAKGRRVSCPAALLDHYQGRFSGGRWVFAPAFWPRWNGAVEKMVSQLARLGRMGALQTTVRPALACYQPGAQPQLNWWVRGHERSDRQIQVDVRITLEGEEVFSKSLSTQVKRASHYQTLSLPLTVEPGLYHLEARVSVNGKFLQTLHQGFWGWDEDLVKASCSVGIKGSQFTRDGKVLPVVGTTYMAGDVSRKFITMPNPWIWDRDMAEMEAAGINMIRTGIWAAHRQVVLDSGNTREDVLCAFDAYILTCLKHGIPVIFNFFSFIPENWPSDHPYLDPRALSIQREYMLSIIRRYASIPSVLWDFINEPSITNPQRLWKTRPLPGAREREAFQKYLRKIHGNIETLQARWNMTPLELGSWGAADMPEEKDFVEFPTPEAETTYYGKVFDFNTFGQEVFADWVADHLKVLKEGTRQLFCVGQDEGGIWGLRPNNHAFHKPLDFTCNHTWWDNEDLVHDVTAYRVKGKPFLAQETGIMFTNNINRSKRRTEGEAAELFERKLAASFMGGNGFVQWCWNVNQYMNNRNEVEIGAFRVDRTARPEALVMEAFGEFFKGAAPYMEGEPVEPTVAVVGSLTGLLSPRSFAMIAQKASHRVLSALRVPFHTLGEQEFDRLTGEKVILLPSPHRMDAVALQGWVKAAKGRVLWVNGPVAQDGWGMATEGLSSFGVQEDRKGVQPEEALKLKKGSENLQYSLTKPSIVDRDVSLAGEIHRFSKNKAVLYYVPVPVESNDRRDAVRALYQEMAATCKIKPWCDMKGAPEWEVTVLPCVYAKTALYIAFNEGVADRKVQIKDTKFGFKAVLSVPAGRAAMAVFDSKGKVLTAYKNPVF